MKKFSGIEKQGQFSFPALFAEHLALKYGDASLPLTLVLFYMAIQKNAGHLRVTLDEFKTEPLREVFNSLNLPLPSDGIDLPHILKSNPKIFGKAGDKKPVIHFENSLYFEKSFSLENRLLKLFSQRLKTPVPPENESLAEKAFQLTLNHINASGNFRLNPFQERALLACLKNPFCLISGGPGTGKTTLIANLLRGLTYLHQLKETEPPPVLVLAAPTGRASGRMGDSLLQAVSPGLKDNRNEDQKNLDSRLLLKGTTLHRLIGKSSSLLKKDEREKRIFADAVLVDEASMIDIELMGDLLEALSPSSRLILIGDKDQLPPVEGGSVFYDLIPFPEETRHPLSHRYSFLGEPKRFGPEILSLANAVKEGDSEKVLSLMEAFKTDKPGSTQSPIEFLNLETIQGSLDDILKTFLCRFPAVKGLNLSENSPDKILSQMNSFKILCPFNEGRTGVDHINGLFKNFQGRGENEIYEGLPILMLENDHQNRIYNGDQGIFMKIQQNENPPEMEAAPLKAVFKSGDSIKTLVPSKLRNFSAGFAITIHKSQGGEYEEVFIVLPREWTPFLSRELIYTALTRARKKVILTAAPEILKQAVQNSIHRNSGVRERLIL